MFYFETFWIILNPSSVKKNKATLGNASNSKPEDSVMQEITVSSLLLLVSTLVYSVQLTQM